MLSLVNIVLSIHVLMLVRHWTRLLIVYIFLEKRILDSKEALEAWQDSPVRILVQKLTEKILRIIHWMIGLVIAVLMGIISLTATAATTGVSLHTEIQTADFVRDWHQYSVKFWVQQNKIDSEIVNEIADLGQAATFGRSVRDFKETN